MKKKVIIALAIVVGIVLPILVVIIWIGNSLVFHPSGQSVAIIGGADGPTSVFIAGNIAGGNVSTGSGASGNGNPFGNNTTIGGQSNGTSEESSTSDEKESLENKGTDMEEDGMGYLSISMETAKDIFAMAGEVVILDVRRADEYAEGHIPGAINIPNEEIGDSVLPDLPDLTQKIYVYCRSGRRSKEAAEKMVKIGYEKIVECGGILDWKGDIEK